MAAGSSCLRRGISPAETVIPEDGAAMAVNLKGIRKDNKKCLHFKNNWAMLNTGV